MGPSAYNARSVSGWCPEISMPSRKVIFTLYLTDRACVCAKNTAGKGDKQESEKPDLEGDCHEPYRGDVRGLGAVGCGATY